MTEERINQIIRESINEIIDFGDFEAPNRNVVGGNVDKFTPYTPQEAEQNRKAIGKVGNKSYDDFKRWRTEQLANGVPSVEASYANFMRERK